MLLYFHQSTSVPQEDELGAHFLLDRKLLDQIRKLCLRGLADLVPASLHPDVHRHLVHLPLQLHLLVLRLQPVRTLQGDGQLQLGEGNYDLSCKNI